ncbi:zinc finger protein Rlf [Xenopus tropicalis]|uniref:Zinc finger protein Rlf n=1 Tax=Xenopus tropicalis TaxID=8364 RepID=A0A8J0QDX5_XENTR|nr:zinc finger protein Rlf [Xenopus tropicalis]|eukprot:NP_001123386.2 zinc finger protein Rlf [Xenopus tropicalis]
MADGKGESRTGLASKDTPPLSLSMARTHRLAEDLRELEDTLKEDDVSAPSSSVYCSRFCEILMQHTEENTASENLSHCAGVYGTALQSFATARPYLTTECEDVLLLLGRLLLSCFEVILSMTEDDLSCNYGLQLKKSIMDSHNILVEFGNNNLQLLIDMVQNGGAWKNHVLVKILSQQPVEPEEVQKWISQEGSCFLQMRIKHLMKSNCIQQAMILSKICSDTAELLNDFFFRQSFITCLCTMLPNEDAFKEISKMDGKEILDTICNLESEGQDNTAFILCTTYLTQQLQNEITSCSWELTLFWSKLQRRIDPCLNTFLERCRQFGVIAKTQQHLFFLIRVVHAEAGDDGVPVSIVLCIRALQNPSNDTDATKTSVCKTIACLLPQDLEVRRACQLTEFLFEPTFDSLNILEELFQQPDQKNDEESSVISNSLRCELLLALKSHWMFDPEFWDWKTLKRHCLKLLGKEESDQEEENFDNPLVNEADVLNPSLGSYEDYIEKAQASPEYVPNELETTKVKKPVGSSERYKRWLQYKFYCLICNREVIEARILHHSKMHFADGIYTCPVCIKKFKKKDIFVPHVMDHMKMPMRHRPRKDKMQELKPDMESAEDACDTMGYISFKTIQDKQLQDRDVYPCPGTGCSRVFKQFKYLSIHLKAEHHNSDDNAKHYLDMKNLREKCAFCRRHFITGFHLKQHMRIHLASQPFLCASIDCSARFNTINELLIHKQSHPDPQYKCELEGCSLVFGDLGLLYHHEAQHFRDASYVCSFSGCKKFYYSRTEHLEHIVTHTISSNNGKDVINEITCKQENQHLSSLNNQAYTLSNLDKLCGNSPMLQDTNIVPEKKIPTEPGDVSCKQIHFNASSHNPCEHLHTLTDCLKNAGGLHCTCKIANTVKVSLQRINPLQFSQSLAGHNTVNITDKKHNESAGEDTPKTPLLPNTEQLNCVNKCVPSSDKTGSAEDCGETHLSSVCHRSTCENTINELLTSLKHLNLKNSNSCITTSGAQDSEANASSSIDCAVPKNSLPLKQEKVHSQYLTQLASKPYLCELKGCKFAFATKDALLVHYVKKHHYTRERTLKLQIFQNKYTPFQCHICQTAFSRRTLLRIHYKKVHHLSKERATCRRGRRKLENIQTHINERHNNYIQFQANEANTSTHDSKSLIQDFNNETFTDSLSDETDAGNENGTSGSHSDNFKGGEGRGRRRVVAQGKLCYILNKYHKPFHCIHNTCNASFTSQKSLVRHYQLVHQYNKESLCLERDKVDTRREYGKCRRIYTCKYKACRKSFICAKALSKHYTEFHNHENEEKELDDTYAENSSKPQTDEEKSSDETETDESEIYCDAEGCTAVFSDHASYTRHILSRHRRYRLYEGRRKRRLKLEQDEMQGKYIASRHGSNLMYNRKKRRVRKKEDKRESAELKSREEALQMCAQNVDITQFPCMIHGCSSVVKLESSIIRHYKLTHNLSANYVTDNTAGLVYCVKNFPHCKTEQNFSTEAHSPERHDSIKEHKIPKLHLHGDIHSKFDQSDGEEGVQINKSDLSSSDERDSLNQAKMLHGCLRQSGIHSSLKECISSGAKVMPSFANFQTCDVGNNGPHNSVDADSLKSQNVDSEIQLTSNLKASFKPNGFESSFLKFLQETRDSDDDDKLEDTEWKPQQHCKLQNSFQTKKLSFRETSRNHHKVCLSQGKRLGHDDLPGFQPLLSSNVQTATSIPTLQTLRTILDKALTERGDLALKQLHYQRPVVVLERSKFNIPLIDLFSSKKTDELCVGIS